MVVLVAKSIHQSTRRVFELSREGNDLLARFLRPCMYTDGAASSRWEVQPHDFFKDTSPYLAVPLSAELPEGAFTRKALV